MGRGIRILAFAGAFVVALAAYVPVALQPVEQEPDLSFRATTHDAFARGMQFGSDIISTYGPWGLLQRGFDARTDRAVLAMSSMLALVFAWSMSASGGRRAASEFMFAALSAGLVISAGGDARFTLFPLLLVIAALDDADLARELPLAAILGVVAQVKFSLLLLSVFVILAISWRRRSIAHAVTFVAGFLIAWLLAGQHLAGLPAYLATGVEIARGYSAASAIGSGVPVAIFGAIGLAVLAAWSERDVRAVMIGGACLYLLKIGYVRGDVGHYGPADALLLIVATAYLLRRRPLPGAVAAIIALLCGLPALANRIVDLPRATTHRRDAIASFERDTYLRSHADRIPRVRGAIDAYPWDSATVIAAGLPYAPRPVFQSFIAWTPALARTNAAHLTGATAPEWLWTHMDSVDEHLPILDDAPSWLEMMRRYDVAAVTDGHALLRRRAVPIPAAVTLVRETRARFGEDVALPDGVVWCEIDARPTIITSIRAAVARPPVLRLEMTDANGVRTSWRVSYVMLRGGFIASPRVTNASELAGLISRRDGAPIRSLRLSGDGFGEAYAVRLFSVR